MPTLRAAPIISNAPASGGEGQKTLMTKYGRLTPAQLSQRLYEEREKARRVIVVTGSKPGASRAARKEAERAVEEMKDEAGDFIATKGLSRRERRTAVDMAERNLDAKVAAWIAAGPGPDHLAALPRPLTRPSVSPAPVQRVMPAPRPTVATAPPRPPVPAAAPVKKKVVATPEIVQDTVVVQKIPAPSPPAPAAKSAPSDGKTARAAAVQPSEANSESTPIRVLSAEDKLSLAIFGQVDETEGEEDQPIAAVESDPAAEQ